MLSSPGRPARACASSRCRTTSWRSSRRPAWCRARCPCARPCSGVVTEREAYEGMQVEPGMALFQVADLSAVWIEARFYESEASLVTAGAAGRGEAAARSRASSCTGPSTTSTRPWTTPRARSPARVVFANDFGLLRPGMYADVTLSVDRGEALVIPDDAVLDTGERRLVFVSLGDGRFTPREVEVGTRSGGKAQILGGLRGRGRGGREGELPARQRVAHPRRAGGAGAGGQGGPPARTPRAGMIARIIEFTARNRLLVLTLTALACAYADQHAAEHPARRPARPLGHAGHRLHASGTARRTSSRTRSPIPSSAACSARRA